MDLKNINGFKKYKLILKKLIDLKITFMAWHLSASIDLALCLLLNKYLIQVYQILNCYLFNSKKFYMITFPDCILIQFCPHTFIFIS